VRFAGIAQRIAGSLLQPTSFTLRLADERREFCLMTRRPEGQDAMRLDNDLAPRFGLQEVGGMKPGFRSLQKFPALFDQCGIFGRAHALVRVLAVFPC
jgi:hypothetical protein